jgi:hypothetical protein
MNCYSIRHLTRFRYSHSVNESIMETRMHPRSDSNQHCLTSPSVRAAASSRIATISATMSITSTFPVSTTSSLSSPNLSSSSSPCPTFPLFSPPMRGRPSTP